MQLGTRETLLANNKPKVQSFEINDTTYFIRELSVGENNQILYGQRQHLIKLAQAQGIELHFDDESELQKQLQHIYDPNALARNIALRLCDENGKNLFDAENEEDLALIAKLDGGIFAAVNNAVLALNPKNSPTDASSR